MSEGIEVPKAVGEYAVEELERLIESLKDPESVLVNMMRGTIATPSPRAFSKLFGDVINGEYGQLLEIARLRARLAKYEDAEGNPIAQPSGVVLPPSPYMPGVDPDSLSDYERGEAQGRCDMWAEVARLNQPASAGDGRAGWNEKKPTEEGAYWIRGNGLEADALVQVKQEEGELWCNLHMRNSEPDFDYGYTIEQLSSEFEWLGPLQARAALSANHSEQVREGWKLVPVEPTDEMLIAGDGFIGTPGTYKAMLSAAPCQAISKEFSQFLSAVTDAAGLVRHGRQSKELSEYLGMKCMEYRGAALSAPSHGEQVREVATCSDCNDSHWRTVIDGDGIPRDEPCPCAAAPSAGSQEQE